MFQVNWEFFQPIGKKFGTGNRTQFCIEIKPCIDNKKVLGYRIRFPAIGVGREVVVAEFSTFYARRRFCAKVSDTV